MALKVNNKIQTAAEVERLKETRDEIAKKIEELDQRFGKVDDEEEKGDKLHWN